MRKTTKEIIELISDYMNKELSDGCLMYYKFLGKEKREIIQIKNSKYGLTGYSSDGKRRLDLDLTGDFYTKKIIGHYDITAVLKYIDKVFGLYLLSGGNHIQVIGPNDRCVGFIPNKPLHLYTEEEIKDLLKLLKLLGKNKN